VALAQALADRGQLESAETEARAALQICQASYPNGHRRTDAVRTLLGRVLVERRRLAEDAIELE
jgi:hypothetical protein